MTGAIWGKDKLDEYWRLQQRARKFGARLTGVGQGSDELHLHLEDGTDKAINGLDAAATAIEELEARAA